MFFREGLGVKGSSKSGNLLKHLQTSFRWEKHGARMYAYLCFYCLHACIPALEIQAFYFGLMCGHTKHIITLIEKEF